MSPAQGEVYPPLRGYIYTDRNRDSCRDATRSIGVAAHHADGCVQVDMYADGSFSVMIGPPNGGTGEVVHHGHVSDHLMERILPMPVDQD